MAWTRHQVDEARDPEVENVRRRLDELADGLITAASELRRLTAELQEGRDAGPGG